MGLGALLGMGATITCFNSNVLINKPKLTLCLNYLNMCGPVCVITARAEHGSNYSLGKNDQ